MNKYVEKLIALKKEGFFDKLALGIEDVTDIPIDKIDNEYYFFHEEQDCYIRVSFGVGGDRMIEYAQEREKERNEI